MASNRMSGGAEGSICSQHTQLWVMREEVCENCERGKLTSDQKRVAPLVWDLASLTLFLRDGGGLPSILCLTTAGS